jgi:hypothetical protein
MKSDECGLIKHLFKSGAEILQQSLNVFWIMYVHIYIGTHTFIPEQSL